MTAMSLKWKGLTLKLMGMRLVWREIALTMEAMTFRMIVTKHLRLKIIMKATGTIQLQLLLKMAYLSQGKNYPPPAMGIEFESYDDAYNYYNCYAKELGFAIKVKSSWRKCNSKEKRRAVICCNCEGFKTIKEANSCRKETRTSCIAMIRLRLVESNRWRMDEVKLEHNHLFNHERAQNCESHKKMDAMAERNVEPAVDVEVQRIKLYRTPVVNPVGCGSSHSPEGEISEKVDRSRAACGYFGDVIAVDSTCLSNNYEVPPVHESGGDQKDVRNIEVMYDKVGKEIRCICGCFNFNGFLYRHSLCVLNYNDLEEIPFQYILSRWRKDFKRLYIRDLGSNNVDIINPVQLFDHLYRHSMQVVEERMLSQDHYMVAWQAFKESLNKVRLVTDKHV
ncbi:hypothetical protein DITRI_Ditri19aG0118500 [Diplodiscus trichospermus]